MCIQLVEKYATCRCIYHVHAVDKCALSPHQGHLVIKREILVGTSCPSHISGEGFNGTTALWKEISVDPERPAEARKQITILHESDEAEPSTIQHPDYSLAESSLDKTQCHPSKLCKIKDNGNDVDDHVSYTSWGPRTHTVGKHPTWTTANNIPPTTGVQEPFHTAIERYTTRETAITKSLRRFAGVDCSDTASVSGKEHGVVECDVSDVESIFDNASVSSKSSIELPFAEELYEELLRNVAIAVPVEIAVRLNANQFETTFTHLLRLFSKDLAGICFSSVEKGASKAIRVRSRFLASKLTNHFIGSDLEDCRTRRTAQKAESLYEKCGGLTHLDDDGPDDDGSDDDDDGFIYPRMDYVKKFLFENVPFVKLVQRLEMLVEDNTQNTDLNPTIPTIGGMFNEFEPLISNEDIAATAALIDIVVCSLRQYTHAVGIPEKPIKHLLSEARDLLELVHTLVSHAKQAFDTETRSVHRRHVYHSCLSLQRLRSLLEDAVSAKHSLVSLRSRQEHWPLSKAATKEFSEELERHKFTLSMVISMNGNAVLSQSKTQKAEHESVAESLARKHTPVTIHSKESVDYADQITPTDVTTTDDTSSYLYPPCQDSIRYSDQQWLMQSPPSLAADMLPPRTSRWNLMRTTLFRVELTLRARPTIASSKIYGEGELTSAYEPSECFTCENIPLLAKSRQVYGVYWVCPCGKVFLESIEELKPWGIRRFLKDVEKTFCRSPDEPGEFPASNVWRNRNKVFVLLGRVLNTFNHAGHSFITRTAACDAQNSQVLPPVQTGNEAQTSTTPPTRDGVSTCQQSIAFSDVSSSTELSQAAGSSNGSDTLSPSYAWIHVCVEHYAGRIQLKSVDIRGHCTDGPMFTKIHEAYFGTGFWRRLQRALSLRVLTGIEFVHFNVDRYKYVAVDRGDHQKLPPPKHYLYQPCPPALAGLIPRHFLYLCITKPELTYGNYCHWRDRMPKYTGEDLRCLPDEPFTPGYGLYFMQGLSWAKVWIVMSLLTVLSFTFSGIWVRFHDGDSIQDAFAMGGSLLTAMTILLGLFHGLDAFWSDRIQS